MFKSLVKAAQRAYVNAFGYRVLVLGGPWHGTVHTAATLAGALAWARCYQPQHRRAISVRNWVGYKVAHVRSV